MRHKSRLLNAINAQWDIKLHCSIILLDIFGRIKFLNYDKHNKLAKKMCFFS